MKQLDHEVFPFSSPHHCLYTLLPIFFSKALTLQQSDCDLAVITLTEADGCSNSLCTEASNVSAAP